jgi:hypothetical protein
MSNNGPVATANSRAVKQHLFWKQLLLILFAMTPAANLQGQATFKLTVSDNICSSTEGFQFRHVEIATSNGLPAAKDISVWCHVDPQNNLGQYTRVIQPIPLTLKAGEVLVEEDLYLPSGGGAGIVSFSLTAFHNRGKRLMEAGWTDQGIHIPDVLIVDGVGVGESQVTFNRNGRTKQPVQSPSNFKSTFGENLRGSSIQISSLHSKIAYLPKRWIGYSSIEQVVINSADLATLSQDAQRFEALVQWVTMGGTLIVDDCGDGFDCLSTVVRYFKETESGYVPQMKLYYPDDKLKSERDKLVCVSAAGGQSYSQLLTKGIVYNAGETYSDHWVEVKYAAGEDGGLDFSADADVLLHRFGLGRMMFHADSVDDKSGETLLQACFLCYAAQQQNNPLGSKNAAGDSFSKWQLLNVGIAPIGLFMFVVVSFMTLIGPLGYTYLKIKQKLHYQIWMVPLISAMACLLLLGYAFISEGVGTKLRPTIFVELDQHRKVAATFARYSVYSALQPPPYQFQDDQFATLENSGIQTPAIYNWSANGADNGYRLSGGNASARNVHQVFVATPVKTNSGIEVKPSSDSQSSNTISLTNRFKDRVIVLAVKFDGQLYFAVDLAPAQTHVGAPAEDEKEKKAAVQKLLTGRIPTNSQDYRFNNRGRYYNRGNSRAVQWDIGVKRIQQFSSVLGISQHLTEGHYIAVLDSMKEVPSVVSGAREIDGSVIVHGKW